MTTPLSTHVKGAVLAVALVVIAVCAFLAAARHVNVLRRHHSDSLHTQSVYSSVRSSWCMQLPMPRSFLFVGSVWCPMHVQQPCNATYCGFSAPRSEHMVSNISIRTCTSPHQLASPKIHHFLELSRAQSCLSFASAHKLSAISSAF